MISERVKVSVTWSPFPKSTRSVLGLESLNCSRKNSRPFCSRPLVGEQDRTPQKIPEQGRAEEVVGRLMKTMTTHGILHLSLTCLEEKDLKAFKCTSLNAGHHVISRPPARDYIISLRQRLEDLFKRGDTAAQRFV